MNEVITSTMSVYFYLITFYFLCIISNSVCDICLTCSCSTTLNEGQIINCRGKHLGSNDMLNFDLLMLDEHQALNKLILSKNNITNLYERLLKKLKHVKNLDLSENLIEEIYTKIFIDLNNFENLNLSKNMLTKFDNSLLEVFPELLALDLSYNQINTIEYRMSKVITKINFLDLSHNNISNFPNMFFESLSNLQYLNLSYNRIHALDNDNLIHLNFLKVVHINNNFLTSLHMEIFPQSLIELYSGHNSIIEIFFKPSQLEILHIEYNRISEIHANLTILEHLQYLNVSGNVLSNFPNILLKNLKILDISCNELSQIPEAISIENFPSLIQLNISKNPLRNLTLYSDLKLNSFIASNMDMLETIEKNTFIKLKAPLKECINLTLSNNKMLSYIHEEALKHMLQNLCSLDLSNNKITYISQELIGHGITSDIHSINLQGNPFKCNCSLQWMLNDLMPKLYSVHPSLLNNLRCAWPPEISNTRMVHWYGWKDQVFCTNMSNFNNALTTNVAGVLNSNKAVMIDTSPDVLIILGIAVAVLTILIIIGFIWTQKVSLKKRRINRKF